MLVHTETHVEMSGVLCENVASLHAYFMMPSRSRFQNGSGFFRVDVNKRRLYI